MNKTSWSEILLFQVSVPIGHPREIDEIFDAISYNKGSSLIRMMGLFLGEDVLSKGVSNYLQKHKYSNAEQNDLWESLTNEAHLHNVLPTHLTVKEIMDTWTLQTGYPVVHVTRMYDKNTALLRQVLCFVFVRFFVYFEYFSKDT